MTYKLKLNQVREVLGMDIKLEEITLLDGTKINVEKLEPGFAVEVIAEDGTKSPAAAGEYKLDDNTIIEVDENGLIMEISTAEEDATAEEEDATTAPVVQVSGAAEDAPADAAPEADKVDVAMAAIHEKMQLAFAAIEEVAKDVASVKEDMAAIKTKMEKFSKAPAGERVPKVNVANVVDDVNALDVKLEAIKSAMKK